MERNEINISNREIIEITGVKSVEGFDEDGIFLTLDEEILVIGGENLHVEELELDEGRIVARGKVNSVSFEKKKPVRHLFDRFRR